MPKPSQSYLSYAVPEDDSVELVMSKLPAGEDLLCVPDIATAMNISNNVVLAWMQDGRLPSLPCGAGEEREHRKVSRNTLRRFLELRQQGLN